MTGVVIVTLRVPGRSRRDTLPFRLLPFFQPVVDKASFAEILLEMSYSKLADLYGCGIVEEVIKFFICVSYLLREILRVHVLSVKK